MGYDIIDKGLFLEQMTFIEKVNKTIKDFSMLSDGDKILVGLSGGPDSVCLIHVLSALDEGSTIHALYIDHGLRPDETPAEITFCSNLCKHLHVPFTIKKIDSESVSKGFSGSKQARLRDMRYKMYEETALEINASKIALGHNKDDQAETVVLNFLRGSGPSGLSGMPPVRDKIIRPIIEIKRSEIEEYLEHHKIDYIIDSSNRKEDYLRNRIRLSLMPLLKRHNPNIVDTLTRTAAIMREENSFMELTVTKKMMKLISRKTDKRIELFLLPLQAMEKVILRRVLMRAVLSMKGIKGIGFIHIEDIIALVKNANTGDRIYLPKNVRVIRGYSTLVITSEPPVQIDNYTLPVPGEVIIKEANASIKASYINFPLKTENNLQFYVDGDRIKPPLEVRKRAPGDFFYPLGFGKRKKVKNHFIDEKIPRDERDSIPLIFSDNDLVWIAGHRGDERFKATKSTKKCVKLELNPMRI